jgi:serine/threonine protein kinase
VGSSADREMDPTEIFSENYSKDTANRYRSIKKIGEGAFGDVWLGINKANGKKIALKQVRLCNGRGGGIPKAVFREIQSLRNLKHPNILILFDVFPQDTHLMLVFEYMTTDLQAEINQTNHSFSLDTIKYYSSNILKGLAFCHEKQIIHRDLKPSNILIAADGVVKLGDFGLARVYDPNSLDSMSHQVATRWYRPPELLFASRNYTESVDVWSAGAIIAELMTLSPLFPGNNDIDQISKVFEVMGTPTKDSWPVTDAHAPFVLIPPPSLSPRNSRICLTLEKLFFRTWIRSPFTFCFHRWTKMPSNFCCLLFS